MSRVLARVGPIVLLLVLAAWLTAPLWSADGILFTTGLRFDGVKGPWFYDFIARGAATGGLPEAFESLGWPCPEPRLDMPNDWDAVIVAPLAWAADWPRSWHLQMAAMVALHGVGVALLARALGARGWTPVVAGVIGMCTPPLWSELQDGRGNSAWLSVGMGAVWAFGLLAERSAQQARPAVLAGLAALAALLGAVSLAIYPPHTLTLAPVGLLVVAPALRRGGGRTAAWVAVALAAGLVLASGELQQMTRFHSTFYAERTCTPTECGIPAGAPWLGGLLQVLPGAPGSLLATTGVAVGASVLAPLSLLRAGSRLRGVLLLLWAAVLVAGALGPCPRILQSAPWDLQAQVVYPEPLATGWCVVGSIHKAGRYVIVAVALLAAAGAVGLDALRRRGPVAHGIALALGLATAGQTAWLLHQDLADPGHWRAYEPSPVATWLGDRPPTTAAILPFDRASHFLADLEAPGHRWLNPKDIETGRRPAAPTLAWLYDLGAGRPAVPPTGPATGLDHVFFLPDACGPQQGTDCARTLPERIEAVLGPPTDRLPAGGLVWTLPPADTAPDPSTCPPPQAPPSAGGR